MFRSRSLRHRLVELVLVAAPLTACEGDRSQRDAHAPESSCGPTQELIVVESEPPRAELLELVRACEADITTCNNLCQRILDERALTSGASLRDCTVKHTPTEHTITVGYCYVGAEGRRPAGLAGARRRCATIAGGHLARGAFYEAASVHAFVQLARELRRHRAPRALMTATRRAAAEEIVHAQLMTGLARTRGAIPPQLAVKTPRRRSIESIAIENAREGLVGETWSAMMALWQSVHAPDPQLRATYARIADDELRHAELALDIDEWARDRLAPAARARINTARGQAIRALSRQVRRAPHRALVSELGLPDCAAAMKLFDDARAQIWA